MAGPSCVLLPLRYAFIRSDIALRWGASGMTAVRLRYAYLAFTLVFWFLYAIAQSAATYAVSYVYLGRPITIRAAYGKLRNRYWQVIGLTFGIWLRVAGWVLVFVLPGILGSAGLLVVMFKDGPAPAASPIWALVPLAILVIGGGFAGWFCVRYAVCYPALVLENLTGGAAVRRSVALTCGHRREGSLAILLGVATILIFQYLFQAPIFILFALAHLKGPISSWHVLLVTLSSAIGSTIAGPLLMIVLAIFYYDLRIRKEAFDLQYLMDSLPVLDVVASVTPTERAST